MFKKKTVNTKILLLLQNLITFYFSAEYNCLIALVIHWFSLNWVVSHRPLVHSIMIDPELKRQRAWANFSTRFLLYTRYSVSTISTFKFPRKTPVLENHSITFMDYYLYFTINITINRPCSWFQFQYTIRDKGRFICIYIYICEKA